MRGQDRLHGDVVLVPPVSWQLLGGFLAAIVLLAALFLATATYSKTTAVTGRLTGDRGIVRAVPARAGIVREVLVREGQQVTAGTPLVRVAIATPAGDGSLEARRSASIAEREALLRRREPDLQQSSEAEARALRARIEGDRAEVAALAAQIDEQRDLVRSAQVELERAQRVATRGFVSQRDVLQRQELLATRRQGLSRLAQDLAERQARISSGTAELARLESERSLSRTEIAAQRAELAGAAAADENASEILVTAAEAGTVTGIVVHRGDAVTPDRPILSIVPAGTRLHATIQVPPAAAGFIAPGQTIRIAIDAFPHATFGTVDARVSSVSQATVPVAQGDDGEAEAFLVDAALSSEAIRAFGSEQRLRPGMTVSARITTRSRSLARLLFEPLYAAASR